MEWFKKFSYFWSPSTKDVSKQNLPIHMHIDILSLHPSPSIPCLFVPSTKPCLSGNTLTGSSHPRLHCSMLLKLIATLKSTVHFGFM